MPNISVLHRISRLYEVPEFVKVSTEDQVFPKDAEASDPRSVYAWPSRQKYPVHTKVATWISAAEFYDSPPNTDDATLRLLERRITEAGAYFGIERDIQKIAARSAEMREYRLEQEPDEKFAFVWVDDQGQKQRKLPLRNSAEVTKAAEWFLQHRDDFVFRDRRQIASKILAADEGILDVDVRDALRKHAADGFCAAKSAKKLIESRLRRAPKWASRLKSYLKQAYDAVDHTPSLTLRRSVRLKLAAAIDEVDSDLNLKRLYDEEILRPEDVLFGLSLQKAAEIHNSHVRLASGTVYRSDDLGRLPLSEIRKRFGDDLAEDVSDDGLFVDSAKLAAIARTLPRTDADLMDRILEDYGIKPVVKEAAAGRQGLMNES